MRPFWKVVFGENGDRLIVNTRTGKVEGRITYPERKEDGNREPPREDRAS